MSLLFITVADKVFSIVLEMASRGTFPFVFVAKVLLIGHGFRAVTSIPHIPHGYVSNQC